MITGPVSHVFLDSRMRFLTRAYGFCTTASPGEAHTFLDSCIWDWANPTNVNGSLCRIGRLAKLFLKNARAWLDLSARLKAGQAIDQKDIRKHRNDVVRLSTIIDPDYHVEIPAVVRMDMTNFITALPHTPLDLPALGLKKYPI